MTICSAVFSYWENRIGQRIDSSLSEVEGVAKRARFVVDSFGGLSGVLRNTAIKQASYYDDSASHMKAATKDLQIDLAALGRGLEQLCGPRSCKDSENSRLVALLDSANGLLRSGKAAAEQLTLQEMMIGSQANDLLYHGTGAVDVLGKAISGYQDLAVHTDETLNGETVQDTLKAFKGTSDNVQQISASGVEMGKSLDAALRPLRTAKGKLKTILGWAARSFRWGF